MRTFLWVFVAFETLTAFGYLLIAAGLQADRRTPGVLILNALFTLAFVGWALWLLAGA